MEYSGNRSHDPGEDLRSRGEAKAQRFELVDSVPGAGCGERLEGVRGVDIEAFVLEDDSLDFRDLRFSHI